MSQIRIWLALTILAAASLLAGFQTRVYAQVSNDTWKGNANNATSAGNATDGGNSTGKISSGFPTLDNP